MRLFDENNKILSVREMVVNTLFLFNESDYINNKIKPINNSKEEILEFAKEAEKKELTIAGLKVRKDFKIYQKFLIKK